MVVAEALAGIALVKAGVDGIKSAITTANDIGDIAHHIDSLFKGEQEIQKKRNKAQKDPFSVNSVAEETINAKLAQEHMTEMKNLVNMRFGAGVWEGIIAERAKRIAEAKEAEKRAKAAKLKARKEFIHNAEIFGAVMLGAVVLVVMAVILVL